jgi:lipopolysaccharide export system protein LptA
MSSWSRSLPPGATACVAVLLTVSSAYADKPKTGSMLPGGDSSKPINIQAVKLDYFDKEQKLVYTGNVVAVQGDSKLMSAVLTIFLAPKKAAEGQPAQTSTNQVQRMIAKGPVTLLQRNQIGTGDNGVYDKRLNTVVLTGNVTLSQGPNVTKGDQLVYDLKSGQAVVTGSHVMSMFLPNDATASNADAKQDPPPAPVSKRRAAKPKKTVD